MCNSWIIIYFFYKIIKFFQRNLGRAQSGGEAQARGLEVRAYAPDDASAAQIPHPLQGLPLVESQRLAQDGIGAGGKREIRLDDVQQPPVQIIQVIWVLWVNRAVIGLISVH